MSSPPKRPQRTFKPPNPSSSKDGDAPSDGRLANVSTTSGGPAADLTKGGNTRMKFTPKPIGRKSAPR